jgi:hypothetical protein
MTTEQHEHVWRGQRAKSCYCGVTPDQECQKGHPRTEENAYHNGKVWVCRVCNRENVATWRRSQMTTEQHESIKANMRRGAKYRHYRYRKAALDAYGLLCACCGESHEEFLCIDHVNNDGNVHREEIRGKASSGGSLVTYRWLNKNGYPEGFQTLCHNCNFAKHAYGACPHTKVGDANDSPIHPRR